MAALGGARFKLTFDEAVAVQPFEGSVTVTTYVPADDTTLVAVKFPLPQLNVAPLVALEAVSMTLEF